MKLLSLLPALMRGYWGRDRPAKPLAVTATVDRPAKRPGKPMAEWTYDGLCCRAHTKSEARAKFKQFDGLKRLPVGAVVTRTGVTVAVG